MKVTIKEYLNVRVGKPSVNAPCYQYLAPGSIIEVDGKLYEGDKFEGNNLWVKDLQNNYYWSGGIIETLVSSQSKITFSWFKELKIEEIWQKYNSKGKNVTVAILDTGLNLKNKDFEALTPEQYYVVPSMAQYDVCNTINDLVGHGTRCASIVGARNKLNFNIGIAPEIKLLIGKISCEKEIPIEKELLDTIQWAVNKGAEIISISYSFNLPNPTDFEEKLAKIVQNKEVFIFASSGNKETTDDNWESKELFPAMSKYCISVGASYQGEVHKMTRQNSRTTIHAPGIQIESYGLSETPNPENGTSFSTPIVAGVMALAISYLKSKNKNWTSEQLITTLYQTGDNTQFENKKIINPSKLFSTIASWQNSLSS